MSLPEPATLEASALDQAKPWYRLPSRYQWIVFAIASIGWIFDAFEGQLFNITRQDMLRELLAGDDSRVKFWGDCFQGVFLVGGAVGGVAFGSLADRIGRKPVIGATILCYSIFSGLTYFATTLWHIAALRFLVAMGVGGEWAVAAALVAEIFPERARARGAAAFHATSVLGTLGASVAGMIVGTHWRYAFLVSALPAFLVFAVQRFVHEPQRWEKADTAPARRGSFGELFGDARWRPRAIFGLLLAAVGLGTFWCIVVAGQDLTRELLLRIGYKPQDAAQQAKFLFGIVQQTIGMGLGLYCFGPLAERLGRRGAFLLMHLAAIAVVPITCYLPHTYWQMVAILPFFGFFCGGMHAGYAVYFPELFPDHLRATGAGVCFNGGRFVAAPMLWISGMIKASPNVDLRLAITSLGSLYLLGIVLLLFLPETKGKPLPTR